MDSMLLRILFPPKCHFCRKVLTYRETDLCHSCRESAPEFTRAKRNFQLVAHWIAVWYYKEKVPGSIRRFKFYNSRSYAKFFARAIAMKLREDPFEKEIDVLTWVPISAKRRFMRGYDQSELLARALGKELGIEPIRTLKKIRDTEPQSGIRNPAKRRANVFGAYQVVNNCDLRRKRILLVDDVITTGATVSECAKTIMVSGASCVYAVAVAATPNDKSRR
jgi:ComF family protein